MAHRTRSNQTIEHVAGLIYDGLLTGSEAHELNARAGWSFEVRWCDQEYPNDRSYTLVEGARLSGEDLQKAIDLAATW
jgi:hypothetical protein